CLGVVGELFRLFLSGRRRHTSSKRDWSSDVCSSDLYFHVTPTCPCSSASWRATRNTRRRPTPRSTCSGRCTTGCCTSPPRTRTQIGSASCREREEVSGVCDAVHMGSRPEDSGARYGL